MEENIRISELLKEQIEKSEYPVVGAKVNNEYKNLDDIVAKNGDIELIKINSKEGMKIYRRTLTFIMGKAFWHIYPEAHIIVDYQLSHAMYCNIENMEITDDMLDESGYVPAERLYGIAIGLARKLVGGRLEATQVGNIKYKKPVTAGTKLIIKMKVARMRQEKKYIYIVMDDKETEVFRAKFIANIASKGR